MKSFPEGNNFKVLNLQTVLQLQKPLCCENTYLYQYLGLKIGTARYFIGFVRDCAYQIQYVYQYSRFESNL